VLNACAGRSLQFEIEEAMSTSKPPSSTRVASPEVDFNKFSDTQAEPGKTQLVPRRSNKNQAGEGAPLPNEENRKATPSVASADSGTAAGSQATNNLVFQSETEAKVGRSAASMADGGHQQFGTVNFAGGKGNKFGIW
jgi:hypothetical protein